MQWIKLVLVLAVFCTPVTSAQEDSRQLVELPDMMRKHMLANMRDHLQTISEIQKLMGKSDWDKAAAMAEAKLGMSSLNAHGAENMAKFMPQGMRETGGKMHKAASRFVFAAQDAAVDGDSARAMTALSEVTAQCVACHAAYRLR